MNRKQRRSAGKAAQQQAPSGKAAIQAKALPADLHQLFRLAVEHQRRHRLDEAEAIYHTILQRRPNHPDCLNHLGLIARDRGQLEEAIALIAKAQKLDPGYAEAHNNMGTLLIQSGDYDAALTCFDTAIRLNRDYADALYNRGTILQAQDKPADAIEAYRRAVAVRPGFSEAFNNMGICLRSLDRLDESLAALRQVLRLRPGYATAYVNVGSVFRRRRRFAEAREFYRRALALDPAMHAAAYNYGTCSLQMGDLKTGWRLYDMRFQRHKDPLRGGLTNIRWRGEDIADKNLLVWREQGVGDEIMFGSCLPDIARKAGKVILECDARLVPIFARSLPQITVRPADSLATHIPDADRHVPIGGMPEFCRPDLAAFPDHHGYLRADPDRIAYWRDKVLAAAGSGLAVGICWRSMRQGTRRSAGYMNLDLLAPLLRLPGIRFFNLQYDDCAEEIAEAEDKYGIRIERFPELDLKNDLDGAAALISALDLVVTAGTSVGEMAAALGIPTWRFGQNTDWSMLGADNRPWYPRMRLFHRVPGTPWAQVVQTLTDALAAIASSPEALRAERAQAMTLSHPLPAIPPATDRPPALGYDEKRNPRFQNPDKGQDDRLQQATALYEARDFPAAMELYGKILADDPANLGAMLGAANIARDTGQLEQSAAMLQAILKIDPGSLEAAHNLGTVYRLLGQYDSSVDILREAIGKRPEEARLWMNLGSTLQQAGDFANARIFYEEAVRLAPDFGAAYGNLALLSRADGDMDQTLAYYAKALEVMPDNAQLHINYAQTLLSTGRLSQGWQEYEHRLSPNRLKSVIYRHDLPRWQGESLADTHLLVSAEQGLGDQLIFATCLEDVIAQARKVTIEVEPRLVPIFRRSYPGADVRPFEMSLEKARCVFTYDWLDTGDKPDAAIPIGSLPLYLRRRIEDFPMQQSYLRADEEKVAAWRDRLAALGSGVKVGLCWRSGLMTAERQRHYTDMRYWGPVLKTPGVTFVNLQYDDCLAELQQAERETGVTIHNFTGLDQRNDLDGTAALIKALDIVISAPTTVQAMAGALGVPTLLVKRHWLMLGTPGFPCQPSVMPTGRGAVEKVIGEVSAALSALIRR
ncbi:MAG: tetratricopeptide repeat protein [Alphaproteobacteria bacterium]|nr:tetratricopeptide repeat protein [Alphaproteobacteria bacterium]MBU0797900.1 tetratricopeptide repeat protein [Alphaproteobacteria bacterium]MBU0886148.1 tetratricopeptide repeat protein [Alphaproteobacteria bacterium]MBU1812788.1 tetratricopeptide repeat protein [Alphaproteobacteria bacterium]